MAQYYEAHEVSERLENNHLCKKYRFNVSLTASIDEFVRFFVFLDEFIQNNNII